MKYFGTKGFVGVLRKKEYFNLNVLDEEVGFKVPGSTQRTIT